MKHLSLIGIFFLLVPVTLLSQNISLSISPETEESDFDTYHTQDSSVVVGDYLYQFGDAEITSPVAWSLSTGLSKLSFVVREGGPVLASYDDNGRSLYRSELEFFNLDDSTIQTYSLNDGRVIVRDNVANFTFLNAQGDQVYTISNSSQSPDGERESEVAFDEHGSVIVFYNPVISYGSTTGSRASFARGENDIETFFNDREREISFLTVDKSGSFITLIASGSGKDVVLIYDRFGNELFEVESEDNSLLGADLTEDARYLTLYSSGRIQVIDIETGEVLGSASSRSTVLKATYFADEEIILALGGSVSENRIADPEIMVVDLAKRQINRENISTDLSFYDLKRVALLEENNGEMALKGTHKEVRISYN